MRVPWRLDKGGRAWKKYSRDCEGTMVKANGRRRFLWKERRRRKSYRHFFFSRWPIRVQLWRLHVLQNNIRSRFLFCARLHSGVEQKHCSGGYIFCSSASPISFSLSLSSSLFRAPLIAAFRGKRKKSKRNREGYSNGNRFPQEEMPHYLFNISRVAVGARWPLAAVELPCSDRRSQTQ